ncbi:MAG: hypothetical protein WCE52_08530 [Candidatus Acidiferrum sp.]
MPRFIHPPPTSAGGAKQAAAGWVRIAEFFLLIACDEMRAEESQGRRWPIQKALIE